MRLEHGRRFPLHTRRSDEGIFRGQVDIILLFTPLHGFLPKSQRIVLIIFQRDFEWRFWYSSAGGLGLQMSHALIEWFRRGNGLVRVDQVFLVAYSQHGGSYVFTRLIQRAKIDWRRLYWRSELKVLEAARHH